jgi:hypothetical protein
MLFIKNILMFLLIDYQILKYHIGRIWGFGFHIALRAARSFLVPRSSFRVGGECFLRAVRSLRVPRSSFLVGASAIYALCAH